MDVIHAEISTIQFLNQIVVVEAKQGIKYE